MNLLDISRPYRKALTANANSSSFPSKVPTVTEPANDGVVSLTGGYGANAPQRMLVLPYGLGSDNDVFDMRVIGWRHVGAAAPQSVPLWVPTVLLKVTCTISAAVGVATAPVLDTERFADTITVGNQGLITGTDSGGATTFGRLLDLFSPTGDLVAWFLLSVLGFEKVEFTFDQTVGTPTTNCLIALL